MSLPMLFFNTIVNAIANTGAYVISMIIAKVIFNIVANVISNVIFNIVVNVIANVIMIVRSPLVIKVTCVFSLVIAASAPAYDASGVSAVAAAARL